LPPTKKQGQGALSSPAEEYKGSGSLLYCEHKGTHNRHLQMLNKANHLESQIPLRSMGSGEYHGYTVIKGE